MGVDRSVIGRKEKCKVTYLVIRADGTVARTIIIPNPVIDNLATAAEIASAWGGVRLEEVR